MPEFEVGLFGQRGLNPNGITYVTVDAPDADRAKQVAEGIYGGRANMGTRMVNKPSQSPSDESFSDESSSSSSDMSSGSIDPGAVGGIVAIGAAVIFLPWIMAAGAGYGAYKVAKGRVSSAVLAGIVAASGVGGFLGGKAIKGEFDSPTPAVVEEVKEVEEAKPLTYIDQTGKTVVDNQDNFRLLPDGSKVWY